MAEYLSAGTVLKDCYEIEEMLGAGGYGVTYRARHRVLDKQVCIKELFLGDYCSRDDDGTVTCPTVNITQLFEECRRKFIKEAQMLASFNFTNIVPVSDVFSANGTEYYVMAYLPGGSLQQLVRHRGPLSCAEARLYTRQVASALSQLHAQQMCHLDVKPGNIMFDAAGLAVLIDFGITKHYDGHGNQTSATPVGVSAGYAPLEQYQGGTDRFSPESDIYSLGATLYYMVTGEVPPEAAKILDEGLPPLPYDIDTGIRAAITASMQPRRADRPQSIAEFIGILGNDEQPIAMPEPEPISVVYGPPEFEQPYEPIDQSPALEYYYPEPQHRRTVWPIFVVLALIAAAAVGLYLYATYLPNGKPADENVGTEMPSPSRHIQRPYDDGVVPEEIIEPSDTAEVVPGEEEQEYPEYGDIPEAEPPTSSEEAPPEEKPKPQPKQNNEVHSVVEKMPQFPGGDAALIQYLQSHIQYPDIAKENNVQGRVVVQFVVTKTGGIGEVKVIKSVDPSLDKEAIRIVKSLPKFNPGKQGGEPVNVWYTIPVNFNLQ